MKVKWSNLDLDIDDLKNLQESFKKKEISGFSNLVKRFEKEALKFTSCKYAIACSNGSVALLTAFMAIKKKFKLKKIKIAVPTWSYIAPANAADHVGKLKLIDSNLDTHNIDFKSQALSNCDVICAVDMAGVPSHYKELKKFNKIIVSDAAESYGSSYFGKNIGSNSLITTTSFQVSKVITTGEGGMIFTNDKSLNEICKLIVNQGYGKGGYSNHDHVDKGFNFRLTGLQAALGLSQLKKLKKNLKKRKNICDIYNKELKNVVNLHKIPKKFKTSFYSYVILLKSKNQRDNLKKYLKKRGIETKLWKPVHLYKPYLSYSNKKFKNAEFIYNKHLRLPVNNLMRENEAKFVCKVIKIFFEKNKKNENY